MEEMNPKPSYYQLFCYNGRIGLMNNITNVTAML